MSEQNDIDELIVAYLVGHASEIDVQRLEDALRGDEAVRRRFAALCAQDVALGQVLAAEGECRRAGSPALSQPDAQKRETAKPVARPWAFPWGRGLLAAACLAIVCGAYWLNIRQAQQFPAAIATLMTVEGAVTVTHQDGQTAWAAAGMPIHMGDKVETPTNGSARVKYQTPAVSKETRVELRAGTDVLFGEENGAKRIRLDRGVLACEVATQPAGRPMRLATPHAEAEVVGTRFVLSVDQDRTRLEVTEGVVRLTRRADSQTTLVAEGQFAEAGQAADSPLAAADLGGKPEGKTDAGETGKQDWLLPLPTNEELAATELKDGEILFQDDFTNGLANWELLHWNRETGQNEPLPEALKDSVRIESATRGDQEIKAVRVDAGDEVIMLALRQPIRERWFAIELEDHLPPAANGRPLNVGALGGISSGDLVRWTRRARTFSAEEAQTQWWRVRWECVYGTDSQGRPALDLLRAFTHADSRGRSRMLLPEGAVRLVIEPGKWQLGRVVIRRLIPQGRANQGPEEAF
jgi:ferric-dicitrate binding protein FerR (iron transport regulator)